MAHLKYNADGIAYQFIATSCTKQPLTGEWYAVVWCDLFSNSTTCIMITGRPLSGPLPKKQTNIIEEKQKGNLTKTVESRAARARISAHETTPGHTFSTASFMSSTTSNPRTEPLFGLAVFSPVNVELSSNRIDPSQPY